MSFKRSADFDSERSLNLSMMSLHCGESEGGTCLSLGRWQTEICTEERGERGEGGKVWSLGVWGENWSEVSSPGAHTLDSGRTGERERERE